MTDLPFGPWLKPTDHPPDNYDPGGDAPGDGGDHPDAGEGGGCLTVAAPAAIAIGLALHQLVRR